MTKLNTKSTPRVQRSVIKMRPAAHEQLRSLAIQNHMPMTKVIELLLAGASEPRGRKPTQAEAMGELAAHIKSNVTVEQTDDGLSYVSLVLSDTLSFILTPERHTDGRIDIVMVADTPSQMCIGTI